MHNITRNNYKPKVGDYHNVILHDPILGKVWIFDCDGIYFDASKTHVIVVNEEGVSEEYAISQKFVTDKAKELKAEIDTKEAKGEAEKVKTELTEKITALSGRIDTIESDYAKAADLAKTEAHIERIDDDIHRLNEALNNLTSLVNKVVDKVGGVQ